MGILDLAPHLRDKRNPTNNLSELKGKILGIDVSILSVRFVKSDPRVIGRYHMLPKVPYLELIHEYFGKIINLFKKYDIKCVFVLDGARNPLKFMENDRRNQYVVKAEEKLKKVYENMEEGTTSELNKLKKDATKVDEYMVAELISYFQRNNHLYVVAPCEADSQLV